MKSPSLKSLKMRMDECDLSRTQSTVPSSKSPGDELDEFLLSGVYERSPVYEKRQDFCKTGANCL